MEEAERLADRIVIVDQGQVVAEGTLPELLQRLPATARLRLDLQGKPQLEALRALPGLRSLHQPHSGQLEVGVDELATDTVLLLEALTAQGVRVRQIDSGPRHARGRLPPPDRPRAEGLMNAFLALVHKDLLLFVQDRRALLLNLLAPVLIAAFFGYLFGGSGSASKAAPLPIAVVNLDGEAALTRRVIEGLRADEALAVELLDAEAAAERVRKGQLRAAVQFPAGFGAQAARALFVPGPKPELLVTHDPSQAMALALLRGLLTQQVMQAVSQDAFSANSPALGAAREAAAKRRRSGRRGSQRVAADVRQHRTRAGAPGRSVRCHIRCRLRCRRGRPARRPQHALHAARRGGRASGA
jgi:hypothetical protein